MPARVVVEVCVHLRPARRALGEPLGPRLETSIVIAAAVLLGAEVITHVGEGAGHDSGSRRPRQVVQTQGDFVVIHQREHAVVVPTGVAELHDVRRAYAQLCTDSSQRLEEGLEALQVDRPSKWKLVGYTNRFGACSRQLSNVSAAGRR